MVRGQASILNAFKYKKIVEKKNSQGIFWSSVVLYVHTLGLICGGACLIVNNQIIVHNLQKKFLSNNIKFKTSP